MNRYFKASVEENLPLNQKTYLLTVRHRETVISPKPGQFYMVEVGNSYDPLLKRPFSYLRKTKNTIQFLYTVKGKGTSLMKKLKKDKILSLIGPLGKGYPETKASVTPVLIAGGIGIASLFPLAERLSRHSCIIYGAKCKNDLLLSNELKKLSPKFFPCTEDCSFGKKGLITDVMNDFFATHNSARNSFIIYACGPKQMLKAVSSISSQQGIKAYASLEENMACGFGACQGCAVQTIYGFKRVCKEGPVFSLDEIVW